MNEYTEHEPEFIVAMANAAANLSNQGMRNWPRDDIDANILCILTLRAAAHGWREVEVAFKSPYEGRRARDARHDAAQAAKHALSADRQADRLSKRHGIPFAFQGFDQLLVAVFWRAFRNIHVEVGDYKNAWIVVAMGNASSEERAAVAESNNLPVQFRDDPELLNNGIEAVTAFNDLTRQYRAATRQLMLT